MIFAETMRNKVKKHPISVVLTQETYDGLKHFAGLEKRPVAQLARVVLEESVIAWWKEEDKGGREEGGG